MRAATRREFLLGAGSVALAALLKRPSLAEAVNPRRPRYIVSTPSYYWGKTQDLSRFSCDADLSKRVGADPDGRSTVFTVINDDGTQARRVLCTGLFHSVVSDAKQGAIYLIDDQGPNSKILTLDAESLALAAVTPAAGGDRTFAGHAVLLPGMGAIAFGMNHHEQGRYDAISIRDARTLKELEVFGSYGFQLHEIRLTQDAKYFVCGHYGSYLGNGVYHDLGVYGSEARNAAYSAGPRPIYPGSVTLVDRKSGDRFRLLSDVEGGQEGHADSDELYRVYLANKRALLKSRPGLEKNPRLSEGVQTAPDTGEFVKNDHGRGICLAYDPLHREVIVPKRASLHVEVTDARTQAVRKIELAEQLSWPEPTEDFLHGLAFHPDGKHYVLSSNDGFIVVERGTHRVDRDMTIRVPLMVHTHLHIA